jgi:hypothetical protein
MMVLSDNTATNMILERFGADMVNAYLDHIGIETTRSMRKILGSGPARGFSELAAEVGSLEELRAARPEARPV